MVSMTLYKATKAVTGWFLVSRNTLFLFSVPPPISDHTLCHCDWFKCSNRKDFCWRWSGLLHYIMQSSPVFLDGASDETLDGNQVEREREWVCVCVFVHVSVWERKGRESGEGRCKGMHYVGVGQWRDGLLMAPSSQLEESCREGKQPNSVEWD